jgi:hypothetical protein
MKPALLAAAALAALAAPDGRLAHAGCAGAGTAGASAGGGDDLHATAGCEDDSDVVGLRRCTRFAAWARNLEFPPFTLEAGALVRRFPSLLGSQIGSVAHGRESFTYRVVQPASVRRFDTALLASLRTTLDLSRVLYGSLEADLGGTSPPRSSATEMVSTGVFGSPDLQPRHGVMADALGVAGVRLPLGFGALGVELAGGVRAVSYAFRSSYHDCRQTTNVSALAGVAEARARGELWLGPWLTAGVTLGTSVLERNNWMGGLYLGVHSRTFGGR